MRRQKLFSSCRKLSPAVDYTVDPPPSRELSVEECLSDSLELGRACLARKEYLMEDTPWGFPDDRCGRHPKWGTEFQAELRRAVARLREVLESGEAGLEGLLELRKPVFSSQT